MQTFVIHLKNSYRNYENFVRKFLFSDYYLCLVSLILFLGWITECAPFGLGALIAITCLMLLGADDILPFTINIFGAILLLYSYDPNEYLYLWPLGIPLGLCLMVFFLKNARHHFTLGKLFFPQLAVSCAWFLGGIGTISAQNYLHALPDILMMGLGLLFVYELFHHYLKHDGSHDIPLWFAKSLTWIGLIICLQVLICRIRFSPDPAEWHKIVLTNGWGNRNSIATYLMFTVAMSFYLSTRYRQGWFFLLLSYFQYFCLLATFSRGGILLGTVVVALGTVFALIKAPSKKRQLIAYGITFAVLLIFFLIFRQRILDMFESFLTRGMESNARIKLYKEAWGLFTAHPLFGVGKGYVGTNTPVNGIGIYWFHSTIMQVLANCGVVGLLAFVYYYGMRGYLLFRRIRHPFHLFVLAAWVGFEGYSLLNTGTMVFYPSMMMIMMMVVLLEYTVPQKSGYATALTDIIYEKSPALQRIFPRKEIKITDTDLPVCD